MTRVLFFLCVQVTVEATVEHPFFVFGRGWSSCSPERTRMRYGLHCFKLVVGDICISLTQGQSSSADSGSSQEREDTGQQEQSLQTRPPQSTAAAAAAAATASRSADVTSPLPPSAPVSDQEAARSETPAADSTVARSQDQSISHDDDDDVDVIVDRDSDARQPSDVTTQHALSGSRESANESASSSTLYVSVDSPGSDSPATGIASTADADRQTETTAPQSPAKQQQSSS